MALAVPLERAGQSREPLLAIAGLRWLREQLCEILSS